MATKKVPSYIAQDRYWKPVIHLFQNHYKLQQYFTTKYFDLENGLIKVSVLKRQAAGTKTKASWSQTEKFMLDLALHLYTNNGKIDLSIMDHLDDYNQKLAMEAISLRFFR